LPLIVALTRTVTAFFSRILDRLGERYTRERTSRARRSGGLGTVAYTPNPVVRVHPGVGHSLIADAPSGAWTNERHDPQK
jgi:hypothetical protein